MYQHGGCVYVKNCLVRNTVTTAGVCVGAGCVRWLCVSQGGFVLWG
jgi:hypothetical protein